MKSILLVDDHKMIRDAFRFYLANDSDFQIEDEASNGQEALDKLFKKRYDIVVTDISMPVMDGIELMENINLSFKDQNVLIITSFIDIQSIHKMVSLGANGYILKTANKATLNKALILISNYRSYYAEEIHQAINNYNRQLNKEQSTSVIFSKGEILVLRMIVNELSIHKIAQRLSVNINIVEKVKQSLLRKTNTNCSAGLVVFALDYGIY